MVVKDRLAEFQSRYKIKHTEEEDGSSTVHDSLITTEDWNSIDNRSKQASEDLKRLEGYLARIKQIHAIILSQPGKDKEFSEELQGLVGKFTAESRNLRAIAHELDKETQVAKPLSAPEESNHSIRVISGGLVNLINKFNNEQADYRSKHLQEIQRFLNIQGHEVSEDDVLNAIEQGQIDNLTRGLMLAVADKKALFQEVQARHSEILALESSIRELHELFHDMHLLVESQGEMIDNIEQNVNIAVDYATKAKQNVIGARSAQKRARKV